MVRNYKNLSIIIGIYILLAVMAFGFHISVMKGIVFWLGILLLFFIFGSKSVLSKITIENMGTGGRISTVVVCILLVLLCVLPMGISPFWNGQIPMHRNQYELMAEAILDGRLYIDYDDIDQKLLEMENPYDYNKRIEDQISVHYDHAFYEGHYYMYFGVVPVFVLFIPFQMLFGRSLVTYHATQFFVVFSIIAFFILFYILAKKFFPKLPVSTYLVTTSAVSLITLGYCVQAPALYCTAISSGICFMLWGLTLFSAAVFMTEKEKWQIILAVIGALSSALAFGCRPPVAFANIVAIPLAVWYVRNYKGKHLVRNFIMIAIPYVIVGVLLMLYNYMRFENPFEFGQAYQLTSYDQSSYTDFFARVDIFRDISGLFENFLTAGVVTNVFPYFNYGGLLVTYPIMWLVVLYYSQDSVRKELKNDRIGMLPLILLGNAVLVTLVDLHWAPGLCERYRLDIYFTIGILLFIVIGYRFKTVENKTRLIRTVTILSVFSMVLAFFLFLQPLDANYTYHYPEKLEEFRKILMFY